ncbi:hypothetical protein TSTA_061260 [Talaromyces stipitatus ATCC 10500]|uniref:Uncharacterized protein n=1 Tax=Talaromyces stipitatus (strain ATCC 10500 / CBS 375.48 / QM 6759 / NRRL 1006) TaxID=441959 RepID=B8LV14_TALSN|nr:uncharacterized protein TSTA_061260 [Talaromyces stipitatus ATCC 10500]EED22635.1 hypothetical protein TSTA_061260 [Talaromyces stipitatus ATCC 10500]
MHKERPLRYYFDNKDEWVRRGINPISAVKSYFETKEHLRFVQSQWDAMNLASTMNLSGAMKRRLLLFKACISNPSRPCVPRHNWKIFTKYLQPYTGSMINHVRHTEDIHHTDEATHKEGAIYATLAVYYVATKAKHQKPTMYAINQTADKFIMEFKGQPPTLGKRFELYLAEIDEPSQYDLPDHTKSELTMATGYFTVATMDYAKFSPSLVSELANRSAAHYLSCLLGNNQECTAKLTPSNEDDTNV